MTSTVQRLLEATSPPPPQRTTSDASSVSYRLMPAQIALLQQGKKAIYNQGTIQLTAQASVQGQAMLDKYAAILNAPVPNDDALPELSAEYAERLEATDLRAQVRKEHGRSV